jgi:hypothetical protein
MSIPLVTSILWLGILSSCTDTKRAHFSAMGSPARVTCYSGGRLVLDDFSTGKVSNSDGSDGYEFKSATTGRLQQASGDCQVDYGAKRPQGWKATLPGLKTDPRVRD